jgi:O-antigen/teichoic acid export membrane protein
LKKIIEKISADELLSHILKSSSGSFLVKIINMLLTLGIAVLSAKWMGAKEFGAFTFAFTIVGFLKFPAMFGLPNLAVREVSKFEAIKDWASLKGFILSSYLLISILSVLLAIATYIVLFFFEIQNKYIVVLAVTCLPFFSIQTLQSSILRGIHKIVLSLIPEQIIKPVGLFFGLIVLHYANPEGINAEEAVLFQVIAIIIGFTVSLLWIRKYLMNDIEEVKSEFKYNRLLKAALPFSFMGSLAIINSQFDILMLGTLIGDQEVGIYKVIHTLSKLIFFVMVAVTTPINPLIAKYHQKGNPEEINRILILMTRVITIMTLPILLTFLLVGDYILSSLFGEEFIIGSLALKMAAIGMFFNAICGPAAGILNMSGYEKYTMIGTIIVSLLNLILNPLLINQYGVNGAAFTTMLCPILANIYWLILINKKTKFKTLPFQSYK